MGDELIMFSRS